MSSQLQMTIIVSDQIKYFMKVQHRKDIEVIQQGL